ncbi:MAG: M20/M25/M40 family metallo-hydrolase [Planctomycetota bacterium]
MEPRELNRLNTTDFRPGERVVPASRRLRSRFHPPTRWIKFAMELLRLPTSPFHEQNIMLWVWRFARNRGLPVRVDSAGNLIVDFVPANPDDRLKRILFTAHMDHIGFWAVRGLGAGRLRAQWMGRFPEDRIVGAPVVFWTGGKALSEIEPELMPGANGALRIGGRKVAGVVEKIVSYAESGDVAEVDLAVEGEVLPGSIGMWDLPEPMNVSGRLSARAIDDVAGVASLICLMDSLNRQELRRPVSCLFTRAEEGGFFGAIRYCREQFDREGLDGAHPRPDLVLSVETSKALPLTPLGSGPIVRVGDRHGVFDPELAAWAGRCAGVLSDRETNFAYQRRLMDGGTCESSVFQAWTGRAGAVCIPLGNYHNFNAETQGLDLEAVDVSDWGNLVRLMLAMTEMTDTAGGAYGEFKAWCEDWEDRHAALYTDPTAPAPDTLPPCSMPDDDPLSPEAKPR